MTPCAVTSRRRGRAAWAHAIAWAVAPGGRSPPNHDPQVRLLAAALYEIRLILGPPAIGDTHPESEAAALSYALHNEALCLLEGKTFDLDEAMRRVEGWDHRRGTQVADRLKHHLREP
jgi:hypothetical protein